MNERGAVVYLRIFDVKTRLLNQCFRMLLFSLWRWLKDTSFTATKRKGANLDKTVKRERQEKEHEPSSTDYMLP